MKRAVEREIATRILDSYGYELAILVFEFVRHEVCSGKRKFGPCLIICISSKVLIFILLGRGEECVKHAHIHDKFAITLW